MKPVPAPKRPLAPQGQYFPGLWDTAFKRKHPVFHRGYLGFLVTFLAFLLLPLALASCAGVGPDPGPAAPPLVVGADISFADQEEYYDISFWDQGTERDILEILQDHGFTSIRLRLFVDPLAQGDVYQDQGYNTYRDFDVNFCGLDRTLAFAQRVKARGLDLLLDFHYSDTWADPRAQNKPQAWRGLSLDDLKTTLYNYTRDTLQAFSDAGAAPDWVQIGNEIGGGFLWDDNPEISGSSSNWDQFTDLLKEASRAVRNTLPQAQIMVHHQNSASVQWFQGLVSSGVDFDLIGLSHYPQFGATLEGLESNLNAFVEALDQDLVVVEYSAQAQDVYRILRSLPEGRARGAFIWEPINWIDTRAENFFDWQEEPQRGHHTNGRIDFYPGING